MDKNTTNNYLLHLATLALMISAGSASAAVSSSDPHRITEQNTRVWPSTTDTNEKVIQAEPLVSEESIIARPVWHYQAWPESTFVRIRPPINQSSQDVQFDGSYVELFQDI